MRERAFEFLGGGAPHIHPEHSTVFLPFGELIFLFLLSDGGEVKIKLVRGDEI